MDAVQHISKITGNRVEILRILRDNGAVRPYMVAESTGKTSSAAVKSLIRLVDDGWVTEVHPEIDGREVRGTKLYRLTDLGCRILDAVEDFVKRSDTSE